MAQTAVLGDSHGNEGLPLPPSNDDEEVDGGVGSELGYSYVDGKWSKAYASQQDDGMKDGGVLELLAQIYGTKAGACTSNLD